jgi:hypothetical protein
MAEEGKRKGSFRVFFLIAELLFSPKGPFARGRDAMGPYMGVE